MRLPFGQWLPDLPPIFNVNGLVTARNMFSRVGGYGPMNGIATFSGATALASRPHGSIAGTDHSGAGFMYAGTIDRLYVLRDAGMVDISKSGGYSLGETDRWSFARWGNYVFAATINHPMQYHRIGSVTDFADVPPFAPRARHVTTVGDFVMAGNIYHSELGSQPEVVQWSAIRDPLLWPKTGTVDAIQVQSDIQSLEGGGWVQDIVTAAEVGVVFQENATSRFDYRGGDAIFERNTIEVGNGMFIPHSGVAYGRQLFYISEDGFRVLDLGAGSVPVGKDRVSSTFLADLDGQYLDRVEVARDPDRTLIWILYPGSGNILGRPNRGILYDYALDRFSHFELELNGLIESATTTAASIDAPASPGDPDDVDDPSGESSFDNRPSAFGSSRMGAFSTTFVASDFTGSALQGLLETGDVEFSPGLRTRLVKIRPLVDDSRVEVAVAGMNLRDDKVVFGPFVGLDRDGTVPVREDARYYRFRVKLPPGWDSAVRLDVTGKPSGNR